MSSRRRGHRKFHGRNFRAKLSAGLFLLASLLLVLAPWIFADFEDLGMGARPMGMGNAFTGLADDVRAIYYNPAGLGWMSRGQLSADYSRLNMGLDDNSNLSTGFIAYAHPLYRSRRGLAPEAVSVSTAPAAAVETSSGPAVAPPEPAKVPQQRLLVPPFGTLGVGLRTFSLAGAYREESVYLSYGHSLGRRWSLGGNLKFLQEKYTQDIYTRIDPVFNNGGKAGVNAVSADLGVLWNYRARFFWGASLLDVNRPDVGLKQAQPLPITYKTGLGYRDRRVSAVVDLVSRDGVMRVGAGGERWFAKNTLGLRMGLGLGENALFNVSCGFSMNFSVFQVDYGFNLPLTGLQDTAGNHRLSFSYRFGKPSKDEVQPGSLEYSYFELQQEKEDLRRELERAQAERDRLEKVLLEEATQRIRERISAARDGARQSPGAQASGGEGAAAAQTYTTRPGDSLRDLSVRFYGSPDRWKEIYEMNRENVGRGGRLKPGTLLIIPGKAAAAVDAPAAAKSAGPPAPKQENEGVRKLLKAQSDVPPALPAALPAAVPARAAVPSPAAPAPKTPAVSAGGRHLVKDGETLKSIAQAYYGDANKWVDIYKANREKISRGVVNPGQEIVIP